MNTSFAGPPNWSGNNAEEALSGSSAVAAEPSSGLDNQEQSDPVTSEDVTNTAPDVDLDFTDSLECTVSDARQETPGGKDSHISYLITTNTTISTFRKSFFAVRRRFSDFCFLIDIISEGCNFSVIPPLPSKHRFEYIVGDRFSEEFITKRMELLSRLLRRLTVHPVLRKSPHLAAFLESNDWSAYMRQTPLRQATDKSNRVENAASSHLTKSSAGSVLENFGDSLINAFSKPSQTNPIFEDIEKNAKQYEARLNIISKSIQKLSKSTSNLNTDLEAFDAMLKKLATIDNSYENIFADFFTAIARSRSSLDAMQSRIDLKCETSFESLEDYTLLLRKMLKARDQKQLDYESLTEYLKRYGDEKNRLEMPSQFSRKSPKEFFRTKMDGLRGKDRETSRIERLEKVNKRIEELQEECQTEKAVWQEFDGQAIRENDIFGKIRRAEIQENLREFVDSQVDFYRGMVDAWQDVNSRNQHEDSDETE